MMAGLFPCPGSSLPLCPFQGMHLLQGKDDAETRALREVICRIPKLYFALQGIITDLQRLQFCQGTSGMKTSPRPASPNRTHNSSNRNGTLPSYQSVPRWFDSGYESSGSPDSTFLTAESSGAEYHTAPLGELPEEPSIPGFPEEIPPESYSAPDIGLPEMPADPYASCEPAPEDTTQYRSINVSGETDYFASCNPSQYTIQSMLSMRSDDFAPPATSTPRATRSPSPGRNGCPEPISPVQQYRTSQSRAPSPMQRIPPRNSSPVYRSPQGRSPPCATSYQSPQRSQQYYTPPASTPSGSYQTPPSQRRNSQQYYTPPTQTPSGSYQTPPSQVRPHNSPQHFTHPQESPSVSYRTPQGRSPCRQSGGLRTPSSRSPSPTFRTPPSRTPSPAYRTPPSRSGSPQPGPYNRVVTTQRTDETIPPGDFELLAKIIKKADGKQVEKLLEVFLKDHHQVVRGYLQTKTSPAPQQQSTALSKCDNPCNTQ